jgi:hypothetical protein
VQQQELNPQDGRHFSGVADNVFDCHQQRNTLPGLNDHYLSKMTGSVSVVPVVIKQRNSTV